MSDSLLFSDHLAEMLKDPEFKKGYDRLGPQYDLIGVYFQVKSTQKITYSSIAKHMGVSTSSVFRFIAGITEEPTLDFMYKFADALGAKLTVTIEPQVQPEKIVVTKQPMHPVAERKVVYPPSSIPKKERFASRVSVPARTKIPA